MIIDARTCAGKTWVFKDRVKARIALGERSPWMVIVSRASLVENYLSCLARWGFVRYKQASLGLVTPEHHPCIVVCVSAYTGSRNSSTASPWHLHGTSVSTR